MLSLSYQGNYIVVEDSTGLNVARLNNILDGFLRQIHPFENGILETILLIKSALSFKNYEPFCE